MLPTLKPGDKVVTFNWVRNFQVGDLVVVEIGDKKMVKRILKQSDRTIFVIGDNTKESADSRKFGPIAHKYIVGKVIDI